MISPRAAGLAAALLLLLAACGSGTSTSAPAAPTDSEPPAAGSTVGPASPPQPTATGPTGAEPPEDAARTLEVTVTDGEVSPPPSQVDLAVGETLTLVVTADRDTELHAHGFELTEPVPAGEPTTIEITGTDPGVYEVELHDPDLLLLQVAVR